MRLLVVLLLCSLVCAETVRFKTSDGIEIVADWYPAKGLDAPTVICVPMYRHTRQTYQPLAAPLHERGLNMLAIDARGHGESAPQLRKRVEKRDPKLFNAMHLDLEAAIRFLIKEKGCDPTRMGLVGASVGCSAVLDATVRYPYWVRAVVVMTPGANYLGVPTLKHLERWPGTKTLVCYALDEDRVSRPVFDALGDSAVPGFYDVTHAHGTRLFGKVEGVRNTVADFMADHLFRAPNLAVPAWKEADPALTRPGFFREVLGPRRQVGAGTGYLMAWIVGDTWHLGAFIDAPFKGKVRFGGPQLEIPFDTARRRPSQRIKIPSGKEIEVSQGSVSGKHWVEFTLSHKPPGGSLRLEFVPDDGPPVSLPGGSQPFRAERRAKRAPPATPAKPTKPTKPDR